LSQADFERFGEAAYPVLSRGERYESEMPMRRADGQVLWVRLFGKAVNALDLNDGSIWVFEDITGHRRAQEKLKLAASVFTHAREAIMITDPNGNIVDVNEAFTRMTGYDRDEVLGASTRILGSGRQPPEFYAGMWRDLLKAGHWSGEIWNRKKNGEVFAEMLTISAVRDTDGRLQRYLALFSDITSIKEHQLELERIAHFDALTGLPNRVLLVDRLRQNLAQCKRRDSSLAVVFLDLDGFKAINDEHGHLVGDQVLVRLAQRLKGELREGDTLARLGGDEFVAVLLSRLLAGACESFLVEGKSLRVSASMGIARYPQDGTDEDHLLRNADHAMYAAKEAGKNRYHFFDALQDDSLRQLKASQERIRQALQANEFVLYYQPKIDLISGELLGAEALIRWEDPVRGLLQPDQFLPDIADVTIGTEVGNWVIRTAWNQMCAWRADGLDVSISVNVSSQQIHQDGFEQHLQQCADDHGAAELTGLEVEVLESHAIHDVRHIGRVMEACRRLGVCFALDDFGTGYSTLSHLKHLPVAALKIDKSFVRDMLADDGDMAIVFAVIGMAKAFGRKVVAEGVETAAQASRLALAGCDVAQGFGIARPMPHTKFRDWARGWHVDSSWVDAWLQREAQPSSGADDGPGWQVTP